MSTSPSTITEADVLDQLMTGDQMGFSAESARAILSLRFSAPAIKRMDELAEKNRQDALSAEERAELEMFLRVGHFVNIMQAKALVSQSGLNGAGT